jgi:hypothetical protein
MRKSLERPRVRSVSGLSLCRIRVREECLDLVSGRRCIRNEPMLFEEARDIDATAMDQV